jgi:hypothetical protein
VVLRARAGRPLRQGRSATWAEVADALGRTPDEVRAELRYYAEEQPDLYHGADRPMTVSALIELGDHQPVPTK